MTDLEEITDILASGGGLALQVERMLGEGWELEQLRLARTNLGVTAVVPKAGEEKKRWT